MRGDYVPRLGEHVVIYPDPQYDAGYGFKKIDGMVRKVGRSSTYQAKDDGPLAWVEFDKPVHFMDMPSGIVPSLVDEDAVLPETNRIGIDTYRAWAEHDPGSLPKGALTKDEQAYKLSRKILMDEVFRLCSLVPVMENESRPWNCVLQAAFLTGAPFEISRTNFGPAR